MNKQEIIEKIKAGKYELESYFTYPTGTKGSSYIDEQDKYKPTDQDLVAALARAFEHAVSRLGINTDNKTAIKIKLEGFDQPVYLCMYDFKMVVCLELSTDRGGTEINIPNKKLQKI